MTYRYDPELAPAAAAAPFLDAANPDAVRGLLASLGELVGPYRFPDEVIQRTDVVPTPGGSMVEIQIIRPREFAKGAPAILWFHGGGFIFGSASMDFPLNAHLAQQLGAVIVSVEYSLAPEHPYPTAVREGFAVLEWMASSAEELGIDATAIAVGGHSAGGCIAAAVALMARDRGGPALCFQALDLPVTDDRLDTPSMRAFTDTPIWDRQNAEHSWRAYLRDVQIEDRLYAVPSRAADLTGLPPAYVSVSEFDPLRDEGMDYARRLVEAGVSTELHLFPGTFHGSVAAVPDAAISRSMVENLTGALGRAFAGPSLNSEVLSS